MTFDLPEDQDTYGLVKPDVRIEGSNLTIIHVSLEQPVAGIPFDSAVDMREVINPDTQQTAENTD